MQAKPVDLQSQPWANQGASLIATRENILQAMKDLHEHAEDTVWITGTETMFERLASIYGYAGGDVSILAQLWPEYYA